MNFDVETFNKYADQVREGLAQMTAMVATAMSPGGGAIKPALQPGEPRPYEGAVPDTNIDDRLAFLDDHTIADYPGHLLGYIQGRSTLSPTVAIAWGGRYPATLTHCQTLRAIEQGVPYDVPNLARWDAATRTWLDMSGTPFKLPGTPDVAWQDWAERVKANRPA